MLLAKMTMQEKLAFVKGGGETKGRNVGSVNAVPRLCLPALGMVDGPAGVGTFNVGVTAFPLGNSQAAAFDRQAERDFGEAVGEELRRKGANVWLGPELDISRYPLSGRTFEQFGEDPFLVGETGVAAVQGSQSRHIITVAKHLLGNTTEDNRNFVDLQIDDRTLHEIYLSSFEAAVTRGRAAGVMCAYNRLNGTYSCSNKDLLTDELKRRLGFRGFVISDWYTASKAVTDANEGLDLDVSSFAQSFSTMEQAIALGIVPMSRLDDMVYRVLWAHFATGLFDHPVHATEPKVSTPAHRKLARHMAANGAVLLKNNGSLLPLTRRRSTIAVVGPVGPGGAGNKCTGGGSSVVECSSTTSEIDVAKPPIPDVLRAIRTRAKKDGSTVLFADGSDLTAVKTVARKADYVLAFGYNSAGEGQNMRTMALDGSGDAYIAAAAAENKNTAVLLATGTPVDMPWLPDVRSVLETWYYGVEGPNAIADMVFGDQSPGGRLPITFPKSANDLPTSGSPLQQNDVSPVAQFSEGLKVGYRWYDSQKIAPLFPFGHGLTYTTFSFAGLSVGRSAGLLRLSFDVRNTGYRAAAAVPQVYVRGHRAGDPPQQLRGYGKVMLKPGRSTRVTVTLDARSFQHWDSSRHVWVTDAGCYDLAVGSSSRAPELTTRRTPTGAAC
jgi:beta-glucosidase